MVRRTKEKGLWFLKYFLYIISMEIQYYIGEVWKDIYYYDRRKNEWVDYRGLYQVSNYGRVLSYDKEVIQKAKSGSISKHIYKGKLLKGYLNEDGYYKISLCKEHKCKTFLIHRIVAFIFVPNPNNLTDINHKDECKTNNNCTNLEWCNAKYNNNYGTRNNRIKEKQINDKNKSKPVLQYSIEGEFIKRYPSIAEAHRKTGAGKKEISKCCNNNPRYKTAKGFIWKWES